jgi:hypothetical protein
VAPQQRVSDIRANHQGIVPLIIAIAIILITIGGVILALLGVPFTFHLGPSPP